MADIDKTTRELEWFELETRMRELLHIQLEPVLSKAREDRETTQILKNKLKTLDTRLKSLELAVLGDQSVETIIENIYKRCAEIEGNRKQDSIKHEQNFIILTENVNTFDLEVKKFKEQIKLLDGRDLAREQQIVKTNENIDKHKEHVLKELDALSENFREMNRVYQEVAIKTEEQATLAIAKANANSLEMGNYKREIDGVRKDVVDSLMMIKEVRGLKLNIEVFESEKENAQVRFSQLSEEISKFRDELKERDMFIDKYIPMQTVIFISDYLYSFSESSNKKKLADYENLSLKEINRNVLEGREILTRQEMADKIINDMKHVEERKVEFQTKEIKSPSRLPNFSELKEKINLKRKASLINHEEKDAEEGPPAITKADVEKIVNSQLAVALDAEAGRLKSEIKQKLDQFKTFLKSFNSEASSMQSQFIHELENLTSKMKLLKSDLLLEISEVRKEIDSSKTEISSCQGLAGTLSQMLICLYEFSQIEQIMQKQDEEDRHNMASTMEKELQNEMASYKPHNDSISLPSANFSFQKKCLSCGTANSLLTGFRTSIVYHPSSLVYRNKKFERDELLRLKGQMLKKCWENNSSMLNFKHEDFIEKSFDRSLDAKIDKSIDRGSRFSRLGSIDEATQDNKDFLPQLVSPSIRSRGSSKNKPNIKFS